MTNKEYSIIMRYFNDKKVSREELEKLLDFENLTMESNTAYDISKLLKESPEVESDPQRVIRNFVHFVKERSGSGEITWEKLVAMLNELYLEDSVCGIRVQRFSKPAYWEIFFNHFDLTEFEDGNAKLTFNQEYYDEIEREDAYEKLSEYDIDMDSESKNVMLQIANKWDGLSDDDKASLISALDAIYDAHYVDKSRVDITKDSVKSITMSNADLVPEAGLRDYSIEFTEGDFISLRF